MMIARRPQAPGLRSVLTGLTLCVVLQASHASGEIKIADPGLFLNQTESVRIKDHRQFTQRLDQIHHAAPVLTKEERWHLRYLDAFEQSLEGDFDGSEKPLRDVIEHSADPSLAAKAGAVLLTNLAASRRYEAAFELANQLTIHLPEIQDRPARFQVLGNLSQMLNLAGQTHLAIKYAHMMEDTVPSDNTLCYPQTLLLAARYNARQLTSSDPDLRQAIDLCKASKQPILVNTLQLTLSTLYLEENKPARALSLLDRLAPGIRIDNYNPHSLSARMQRAQAYEKLNRDDEAVKAALGAVSMARPGEISGYLKGAYEVLYTIAKRRGDAAQALSYYEHYITQNNGAIDDASAQALAYQTVQQQVLIHKLESEELSKQNNLLLLQQALDTKAVETGRLYITLLLLLLASIAFWLYRIKRSQLRFKWLSHRDGLTGILNYQYFVTEAERVLRQLEKKSDEACLISIDLDHFKRINDTHGHAVGDAVLRHTVEICQRQLRPTDRFGRLGGEEFGILLCECSRERGMEVANRIRMAIGATPLEQGGLVVSVFASVGLAATDISGFDLQRLSMEADAALYRAKRGGRNRVIADIGDGGMAEAEISSASAR